MAVLLLAAPGVTGCRGSAPSRQPDRKVASQVDTPATAPPLELALPARRAMVQLEWTLGELERRLQRGALSLPPRSAERQTVAPTTSRSGAIQVVQSLARQLPQVSAPGFSRWRRALIEAADAAPARPDGTALGVIVETCLGCHRLHAPAVLPRVLALDPRKNFKNPKKVATP